jgi:CheY-like chemotaxis protein
MKILVVDGEPGSALRLAGELTLAQVGECRAVESAAAALEIADRELDFDVLVAALDLAGTDGRALFAELSPRMPGLRAIFLAAENEEAVAGEEPVLAKPVNPTALADLIRGTPTPSPEAAESSTEPEVGMMFGSYRVDRWLGEDRDGNFYQAVQTSIDRPVELHALDPERSDDPAEVARFLADARAKANVHHPALLTIFEAGEQDGVYFYTSEPRGGASLADLAERGATIEPRAVLQILHTVADVMVHFAQEKVGREPLAARHVMVDHRQRARLVNTATTVGTTGDPLQEIPAFSRMLAPLVANPESAPAVGRLLFDMESDSITLRSWNALLYEVKRCASGASSPQGPGLDASGRAAIAAVGLARKRHRLARRAITAVIALALAAGGGFLAWKVLGSSTGVPKPVEQEQSPPTNS